MKDVATKTLNRIRPFGHHTFANFRERLVDRLNAPLDFIFSADCQYSEQREGFADRRNLLRRLHRNTIGAVETILLRRHSHCIGLDHFAVTAF